MVLIQTEEAGINQKFNTELSKLMDPDCTWGRFLGHSTESLSWAYIV